MARTLKVTRNYSDVQERNIFIAERVTDAPQINSALTTAISRAVDKVCVVLESGLTDVLMQILLSNTKARKYIVVSQIKEEKLKAIAGKAIIREVPTIRGNYMIVDEKQLFMFDCQLNGVAIAEATAVRVVQQVFMHEFWSEEAKFEFVDKKEASAEITFDLPPIYSNESVLIDFSQGEQTQVGELIAVADEYGFIDKIGLNQGSSKLVLKNIASNKVFLEKTNNEAITFAPALPFSFIKRGQEIFACNFDIEQYAAGTLQEMHQGRLFAVRCKSGVAFGETYKFAKQRTRADLLGVTAIDIDGKPIAITETATEERTITIDIGTAREYTRMPHDTLYARLEAKYCDLLYSDKKACKVTFNITVELLRHKMKNKAGIYTRYETLNRDLGKKAHEIVGYAEAMNFADLQAEILMNGELTGNISTVSAYESAVATVNGWADKYKKLFDEHSEIDDSLAEVKGVGKKKKQSVPSSVPKMSLNSPNMNLPKFGTLYQEGNRYEYVVKSEDDFDSATAEMAAAQITDITYYLE